LEEKRVGDEDGKEERGEDKSKKEDIFN